MSKRPGYKWRYLAWDKDGREHSRRYVRENRVKFDELVIDDWFHIEEMTPRHYWMRVCDTHINVVVPSNGKPYIASTWEDEPTKEET